MFSQSSRIMLTVVAFPLMITFLVRDCSSQKKSSHNQSSETHKKMTAAQTGTWGGEHISLEIDAQGGRLEYDCAHGTIDEKIVTDREGRFDLRGTHVREHGGPVRRDETADSHPSRFTGQIKGDTMTLKVTESDTKEVVGTFTLVHGRKPALMKCR